MTRLLLDEMLGPRLADQLRTGGVDVVAVVERVDLRGNDDAELLDWATREHGIVVTDNVRDFIRAAAARRALSVTRAGICLIRSRSFPYGRSRERRIAGALLARSADGSLPGEGTLDFLRA